ncbi:DUF960 domain-containing protein [Streptococcus ovis]|uniref:DUF960 domain-containing protein n=1 Tax=Streptococcus ovis TaxID=82806 RepID=UPI00036FE41D|nr:DUF960 domain-containing protein [Streptococcus ovis]
MAFTNTTGRYASFGIVTSLPSEIIDSFWYTIDQYLKHVIPLKKIIHFKLRNNKGKVSITFSQDRNKDVMTIDTPYKFDPFYPHTVYVIDRNGRETITLPDELTIL